MLFVINRLIFFAIVFTGSLLVIKKSRSNYKRRWMVIAFMGAIILITVSALIPIEDNFITFSSPASAFNYNHTEKVDLIVNGKKTDFVVGTKGDTDVYTIVPKSNDGWKMGMGLDTKQIVQTISDGIAVYLYQYKNTNDYYITVLDTNGGSSEVADNRDSKFKCLEKPNNVLNKTFYSYYAYIDSVDKQYALTVNGKLIQIQS